MLMPQYLVRCNIGLHQISSTTINGQRQMGHMCRNLFSPMNIVIVIVIGNFQWWHCVSFPIKYIFSTLCFILSLSDKNMVVAFFGKYCLGRVVTPTYQHSHPSHSCQQVKDTQYSVLYWQWYYILKAKSLPK